ncbi:MULTISPECIES: TlpA disulfide reductase family protein [unclassified Myroides]|uniref:TlpA family protein disulfide reductase n=1 Tax=unclassified Myroides TaxID=2642485 RepID=UPI0015FE730C|nr:MULTISPECIES: TlpA disulfide reductase family protein [unclassified Myroides]MBB1151147.1 TlpA family protein disulfide reductase [Myroides sp. NP-2]MDM1408765.1 TlpA family protein disulfide reductase [Myroides sp. DF42-4-2]
MFNKGEKKKKGWIGNAVFLLILFVVLFTPLGTTFKVWINQLLAMSPSLEKQEDVEQVSLEGWTLLDEEGRVFDIASTKGKVVILNFWATWCPPCIAEKPSFQALYNDYKDSVVFLFVTSDDPNKVKAFKEKHGYNLPSYFQQDGPPAALYSTSLPASYVIDKKGNIVVKKFRAADWNSSKFRVSLDELIQAK